MEPTPGREIAVRLRYATIPASPEGLSAPLCQSCQQPLDIHQPDSDLPYRMLATCDACKAWHLVECAPDSDMAVIVLLPDSAPFLEARPATKTAARPRTKGHPS
jgi:hypothetical protein